MALIFGTLLADSLNGTAEPDVIAGLAGDDTLRGGARDLLAGGAGNDTYILDSRSADVFEARDAGNDTVVSTASYKLGQHLENLVLAGSGDIDGNGNQLANGLTGNSGDNRLNGQAGNDVLSGGGGADDLRGGAGNDRLVWDAADARIDGGGGADTLAVNGQGTSVDLSSDADAIRNVEVIDLTGAGRQVLIVTEEGVREIVHGKALRVTGNGQDSVFLDDGWTRIANVTIDANSYAQFVKGGAKLQIAAGMEIGIPDPGPDPDPDPGPGPGPDPDRPFPDRSGELDGTNGFTLVEERLRDYLGISLSRAGDVNGDGFDDFVVGAMGAHDDRGTVYVIFGAAGGFDSRLALSGLGGSDGFKVSGDPSFLYSGRHVAGGGDVNGDGFSDILVSSDGSGTRDAAHVIFGGHSVGNGGLDLADLDGDDGSRFSDRGKTEAGRSVGIGDFNGDGYSDVFLSADGAFDKPGYCHVLFGTPDGWGADFDLGDIDAGSGFTIHGEITSFSTLYSISAGDLNGDGYDDLVLGTPLFPSVLNRAGVTYVVFGGEDGTDIDVADLDGDNGFRVDGLTQGETSGQAVAAAGDINGDGFGDLIIGAKYHGRTGTPYSVPGACYVIFGSSSLGAGGSIDPETLDGSNGFLIRGEVNVGVAGNSVAGGGDFNGDGYSDLLVGANSGRSHVVLGGPSVGAGGVVDLALLDGTDGFTFDGLSFRSQPKVSFAGDLNGDGFDDMLLGHFEQLTIDNGAVHVVFGGNFDRAVDYLGRSGNDRLTGTAAAEAFVGGRGSDVLTGGGGRDSFRGGAGDDTFKITDAAFLNAAGGSGVDSLEITGGGRELDLTRVSDYRTSGIEVIDLNGAGANTLVLGVRDLLALSDTTNVLTVRGGEGDEVVVAGGNWDDRGLSGSYHVYARGAATLRVHEDISSVLFDGA